VIAELAAMHPTLPMVFAGNRKLANRYAMQFFATCSARMESAQLSLVSEADASYDAVPVEQQVRDAVLAWPEGGFATADLAAGFSATPSRRIHRVLGELEAEGLVERVGRGRGLRWKKKTAATPGLSARD